MAKAVPVRNRPISGISPTGVPIWDLAEHDLSTDWTLSQVDRPSCALDNQSQGKCSASIPVFNPLW